MYDRETYKKASTIEIPDYEKVVVQTIVGELGQLAQKLVQSSTKKSTYAFIALTSDNGNVLVENYVTDALTEAMFDTGKIKIVERASIEKIMSEQQFQSTALVNENTAVEIGNLSGANFVCYGTVKDLGSQLTLNVKVVEVSTAELCSMGRETVNKDKYLQTVGFEKRKGNIVTVNTSKASTANEKNVNGMGTVVTDTENKKESVKAPVKKVSNNQWKVEKVRNDFDGCSVYTFTITNPDKKRLLIGLKKFDISFYSIAAVGLEPIYAGAVEIKVETGSKITRKLGVGYEKWYLNGHDGTYYNYAYNWDIKNTKWFFDLCLNNNTLLIRDSSNALLKFQTAGLEEKIIEVGLTIQDFYDAFSNGEF